MGRAARGKLRRGRDGPVWSRLHVWHPLASTVEPRRASLFPLMRRRDVMAMRFWIIAIALSLTVGVCSTLAQATYPERAIEMIITFPPGGPTDTAGRLGPPFL